MPPSLKFNKGVIIAVKKEKFFLAGTNQEIPSGQDGSILLANQNMGLASTCPPADSAPYYSLIAPPDHIIYMPLFCLKKTMIKVFFF